MYPAKTGLLAVVCAVVTLLLASCAGSEPSAAAQVVPAAATSTTSPLPTEDARPIVVSTTDAVPRAIDRATGSAARDFELTLLDGETVALADYRGKVVVLNFWASWCVPCRWEMPYFQEMWEEYEAQGVIFVGVAVSDEEAEATEFATGIGVTYPIGLDATGKITRDYRITSLPTTYIIDRNGNESRKFGTANETVLRTSSFLNGPRSR